MKTILTLVLIACLCPVVAWAFSGSSDNYQLDYCIEGIGMAAGSTTSYQLRSNLLFQPVGTYQTDTHTLHLGPYSILEGPGVDTDGDGVSDSRDNCPATLNPDQLDTYPPGGNDCGNACECEGNFNGDTDVDGTDAASFKFDFGSGIGGKRLCTNESPCNGDFTCDKDVDGTDAALFKSDFGRGIGGKNNCPICVTDPWCVY